MSPEMSPESLVCCVQHKNYLKYIPLMHLLYEMARKIVKISTKKTLKEHIITGALLLYNIKIIIS